MGCDIHTITEIKTPQGWQRASPDPGVFLSRVYRWFAFLADVRNSFGIPCPFEGGCRGWPVDHSGAADSLRENYEYNGYGASFVTLQELLDFDYNQTFENLENTKDQFKKGMPFGEYYALKNALLDEGLGNVETFRDFLRPEFFENIEILKGIGQPDCVRVLMLFED